MPDEKTVVEQPKTEAQPEATVATVQPSSTPFGRSAWSETPPEPVKTETKQEQPKETKKEAAPTPTPQDEEEILDPIEWLKREGIDVDIPTIKSEREEYRKLKETKTEETKWENEQSKQIYELLRQGKRKDVREFLETQERLEAYTAAEVNKDTAADIIKLGMQLKYKDLTPKEIDYKYNKEFSIPKAPTQEADELPEDFEIRKQEWQDKVNDIEMNKVIEAKLVRPELEKLKANIVLPELERPKPTPQQPSQESLDAMKEVRDSFLRQLESDYSKVQGFETKVKDESVEIPVSFKIPSEDLVAIKGRLTKDLDVEEYFGNRWFDDKGSPKIETIISDIYDLENRDKILSGVANNAANKRLEEYIKSQKNISLGTKTSQSTFQPDQQGNQKVSPFSKDAWSEKPPNIVQN